MKRYFLSMLLSIAVIFSITAVSAAVPSSQNSSSDTEGISISEAFGIFSELLEAGAASAGSQTDENTDPENDQLPQQPEPETVTEPLPTVSAPDQAPIEETDPQEADLSDDMPAAPEDPEPYAVSTGIEVRDFYEGYKSAVKETGRHSVGFEEKGGKNASRIEVDDNVTLLLHYSKDGGDKLVDSVTLKGQYSNDEDAQIVRCSVIALFSFFSEYLDTDFDEEAVNRILETAADNGSVSYSDLLIYGKCEEDDAIELRLDCYYTGSGYTEPETTSFSQSAENEFRDLISEFKEDGVIPDRDGEFYFHEDYQTEWAQINWYQWDTFAQAENFVISTDITWNSASPTPNYPSSGCGFVLRGKDSSNHIYASLNMDGKVHLGGAKNGLSLSYEDVSCRSHSVKGTAQLILVANGETVTVYIDGSRVLQQKNIAITEPGGLAFLVMSGTNKSYGTRCGFSNVYYYIW